MEIPARPEFRADGSRWFLDNDKERYPISQDFAVGPTMEELDKANDSNK
jgi:hypothetical protein